MQLSEDLQECSSPEERLFLVNKIIKGKEKIMDEFKTAWANGDLKVLAT
jgi:hypothetical protein